MNLFVPFLAIASCALVLNEYGMAGAAMTDKATGISFAPKHRDMDIFGVGVRKKGPIKVYSVGMYCSSALKETLSTMSRTADKGKKALETLCAGAKEFVESEVAEVESKTTAFVLKMNFKVGAEKMASAIAESVAPRHSGPPSDVEDLKGLIFKGVASKGAAVKGTTLEFDCSNKGVDVVVDGQDQGTVPSAELAQAFCDVYLDDDCVSPKLRESCLENCCAP